MPPVNTRLIIEIVSTKTHKASQVYKSPNCYVVLALLEAGADVHAKTKDGKTALDLIQENDALKDTKARWKLHDLSYED